MPKNIFIKICLALILATHGFAGNLIYIYKGPGTSKHCLIHTLSSITYCVGSDYKVKYISPKQLINEDWEKKAALLVIPGGADVPYTKALNGAGNQKIKAYVENGGSFLGICAGGYYGGNFVDFAKDTDIEVEDARELSFFPGTVRGPIFGPYDYLTQSSAKAIRINWGGPSLTVYYNGGGYFVDASEKTDVKILANYDFGEAAIVECKVCQGIAILSGVHFEYDPRLLEASDIYLQKIIPDLKENDSYRIQLMKHLLGRLLP